MRRAGKALLAAGAIVVMAGAGGWVLSAPRPLDADQISSLPEGDAARGEQVFWAAGCASCHAAPGASGDDLLVLAGGVRLETDFGTFVAPNISPHPQDGIGGWTAGDLANAMLRGVSPDGEHYYPAFPYTSYTRMEPADIADLHAFLMDLPPVEGRAMDHALGFPFSMRRGLGLWKRLHLSDTPVVAFDGADPQLLRGQYLVEGPGHCAECHTPRDMTGGLDRDRWMAGAVAAEGQGTIPNITGGDGGIGDWSAEDISALLSSGFTPEFDSVGGSMAAVVRNLSRLPQEDLDAMAAYLKAIPDRPRSY